MISSLKSRWDARWRRFRVDHGFTPEGRDTDLLAEASAGTAILVFTGLALLVAVLTGEWTTTAAAFIAGWAARSNVPIVPRKK